ncbi:family 43 glycosylhydrolase [Clostridium sp. Marseille-P2415]|uniref:family 43 glycosylhydrolase n=2 Tax=Clostridium sp. Marseille-P2415 TaxID=1805471 RepID=UPI0013564651|nr:family 43 glycosylhydrolase [Clostridium sp. Marseille-P2415]
MKKILKIVIVLAVIFLLSSVCYADNPVISNLYTADPAVMVDGNTVYLYTGHDEGSTGYVMKDWKCYSSTDMVNWTDCGTPLAVSAFSWSKGDAWAGQVIKRNGKYYWYVCTEHKTKAGKAIGVAVSNSPAGPFTDALGYALITNDQTKYNTSTWDDIDPTVFIDDDGQAYLYWGNNACYYVKLNSDMISYNGSIHTIPLTTAAFGPGYTEAPWLYKHNGLYYLAYAAGFPEWIAYSTSTSPTGPWTYRGIIQPAIPSSNTIHPAIIDFKGSSYLITHNGALPAGGSYKRSVCIEEFAYNSDGTIPNIYQTSTGVNGVKNRIQSYNFQTMFWRHLNGDAKIDPTMNPGNDSEWQIVPGLANSASGYVSFQSVSQPGYYLRHSNYDIVLAKNDGTPLFASDATFKEAAGLKDSTWTSFQSYNYPDRYIRHSNYNLRIDQISTDTDKQDATFRIMNSTIGSPSYVKIANRATGLCIDGYGYTENGSNCNQYASGTSENQQWIIEPAGLLGTNGGCVTIRNRATGLFLDGMGRTASGSVCGQYAATYVNNQLWVEESAGSYVKFKNLTTGLYLDGNGLTTNGAALYENTSSAGNNQQWSIVAP